MFEEKKIIGAAEISRTESGIFVVKNKIYIPEVKTIILTDKGAVI